MQTQGIKQVQFEATSSTADWLFPYRLIAPQLGGWDPERDQVVLGMSPDYAAWDDYGFRQRGFPGPAPDLWHAPFFQAASDDGRGIVTLVEPNLIDIVVPWNVMRSLGPGACSVGVQYRRLDGTARRALLVGRLPIVDGVI